MQLKWKLLLFYESDFFLLRPVYFLLSFNRAMSHVFILSQIKKRVFFFSKPKWLGLKRTYNLCIVKKAKLDISVSHRFEIGKGGGLGGSHKISKNQYSLRVSQPWCHM